MNNLRGVYMKNLIITLAIVGLALTAPTQAHAIIYSDDTFNPGDWFTSSITFVGGGSHITTQELSGGNPDAHRKVAQTVNGGDGSAYWLYHSSLSVEYDPFVSGAITSIDFSIDTIMFEGFGQGQRSGLALLQGPWKYHTASPIYANQAEWTANSLFGLTESDFVSIQAGASPLDFSASGSPITFGYLSAFATGGNEYSITSGYDNWRVAINEDSSSNVIPEPATMLLFGSGLAGAFIRKRRKS